EDGIRDWSVTGVQTCALPISHLLFAVMAGADNFQVACGLGMLPIGRARRWALGASFRDLRGIHVAGRPSGGVIFAHPCFWRCVAGRDDHPTRKWIFDHLSRLERS